MSDSIGTAPPDSLACAALSDAGRVRAENQDAAAVVRNTSGERLLIVADGMGGHLGGQTASRMCLELVERCFRDPHGTPEERLRRGLVLANEEIYSHALGNPELRGMGTTAVVLLLAPGGSAWVAWVGDSRAYRLRAGTLEALTRDHSLMAEWISLGVLTADAAETHPRRHELTRALGQAPDVAVDVAPLDVHPGDRFLLCSDGLHGYVPERALRAVLAEGEPDDCVRILVERANANGGSDNVSVVVAVVPSTPVPVVEAPPPEIDALIALDSPPEPSAAPDLDAPSAAPPASPQPAAAIEPLGSLTLAEMSFGEELTAPEPEPLLPESAPLALEPTAELSPEPEPVPAPTEPEAPGALTIAELSFPDVLAPAEPEPLETPAPVPAAVVEEASFGDVLAAEDALPEAETLEAPSLLGEAEPDPEPRAPSLPLLDPPPAREIQIPLMTPVRARRGLDTTSVLAGIGGTLFVSVLLVAGWLYTGSGQSPEPVPVPVTRAPARQTHAAAPRPPAPRPAPAPAPAPPTIPTPLPAKPQIAEVVPPPRAKLPAPGTPPLPAPPTARSQPTTTVVVVPPQAPSAPPAAPDPGETATSAGFELPAPVERFVDDWLRAVSAHDVALLASLGLRGVPDDFAGTFATRDSFRLVAASLDEERSHGDRYFVRLVVSYAFRDATGRFRTQDEQRWILRDVGGALRYEGRWQR